MAVIDRQEVLERLGGDEELYAEICALFLRDGLMMLSRLKTELAGGTLEIATRYAQSIRSMAANVGAKDLAALADKAEQVGRAGDAKAFGGYLPQLEQQLLAVLQLLNRQHSGS